MKLRIVQSTPYLLSSLARVTLRCLNLGETHAPPLWKRTGRGFWLSYLLTVSSWQNMFNCTACLPVIKGILAQDSIENWVPNSLWNAWPPRNANSTHSNHNLLSHVFVNGSGFTRWNKHCSSSNMYGPFTFRVLTWFFLKRESRNSRHVNKLDTFFRWTSLLLIYF